MNKISGNSTFFYKYIFPFLCGGVLCLIMWILSDNIILEIIIFLLASLIYFLYFRRLSEVFIDHEKREFCIIYFRKKYYYKFSELKKVKPFITINLIKLKFNKKSFLFSPSGVEWPDSNNRVMINELKGIALENNCDTIAE
jgi:hypothetical protein